MVFAINIHMQLSLTYVDLEGYSWVIRWSVFVFFESECVTSSGQPYTQRLPTSTFWVSKQYMCALILSFKINKGIILKGGTLCGSVGTWRRELGDKYDHNIVYIHLILKQEVKTIQKEKVGYYIKPQMTKIQRTTNCGVPSPSWYTYNMTPLPKA